jgi:UPF0755 protein
LRRSHGQARLLRDERETRPETLLKRLLLLLVLLAVVYGAWWYETRWPVRSASQPPQRLLVPPGTSVLQIGRQLQGLGLVRHAELFRLLVLERGATGKLKAGEYELSGRMSLAQIVGKMARGDVIRRFLTFPEGSNLDDMGQAVAAQGLPAAAFLAAARDPAPIADLDPEAKDLEGYLFPDTYEVPPRPDAPVILVHRMVERFRKVMEPEMAAVQQSGRTLREVVTLASLVELETARPEERPRVAAVFLNRLQRRMPLQTDPTVLYAMSLLRGSWVNNITRRDLETSHPYNTYTTKGLPPGPIANPGAQSLAAALNPARCEDLYFVSRNDGTHVFCGDLKCHTAAVEKWQREFFRKKRNDGG